MLDLVSGSSVVLKPRPKVCLYLHDEEKHLITLQLKKLGNSNCYLDFFHLIGVFIRRGP
jgi:hypothetical protein